MIDAILHLGGKELPIRRTLGAMKKFDAKYKGEISLLTMGTHEMTIEHMVDLLYLFVEAGYRAQGQPCDVTVEWVEDNVTMTDLKKITSALTGEKPHDTSDDHGDEPKKKYKGGE
jgi:hypothetical protein